MKLTARILLAGFASAGLTLCGAAGAMAGPKALTDGQLDGVTAGATVMSSVDAAAIGALALTGTQSNSFATRQPSEFPGQPELSSSAGATEGTAVAVGTNVGVPNGGPTGASTNVQTGGYAAGNQVLGTTANYTVNGAGGVVFQTGWTAVFGAWFGL